MFEQSASPDDRVSSPSPEQRRQMPKYGRTITSSEPPKWQKKVATTERKAYSPVVRGKGNGLFSEPENSTQKGNVVGWPSPDMHAPTFSGSILPSQIRSQNKKSPSPVKSGTSSGVLGSRDPKASSAKTTPVYLNRKSPQPESPYNQEVKKVKSPVVGWPSSETEGVREKVSVNVQSAVAPKEPNPEASFSQDENEAPTAVSSPSNSRAPAQKLEAVGSRVARRPRRLQPDSDAMSATGTLSTVASLQQNLKDASVVMQEERESIASASTSARSSLSVDELSSIAKRALRAARDEEKKQPPKAITTKTKTIAKPTKSPRRRRQIQRLSQQHGHGEKSGMASKSEQQRDNDGSSANASTRVPAISNGTNGAKETAATRVSVVSHGKSALLDKKSRNQLFETARQRNRSPSPLTMAATPAGEDKPAKSVKTSKAPHPENDPASRRALLSAGRRRISSSGPLGIANAPLGHRSQSSFDTSSTNNSEDETISTKDTNPRRGRRASRMAVLAAAHRQSPVPKAMDKTHPSSTAQSVASVKSVSSEDSNSKHAHDRGSTKSRSATALALSSSTNRSVTQTKPKNESSADNDNEARPSSKPTVREESNATRTSPLVSSRKSDSISSKQPTKTKPEVESKSNVTRKFSGNASHAGSAFSSPRSSLAASPSGETKSKGPRRVQGESPPARRVSGGSPRGSRVSDHPAVLAKRGTLPSSPQRQKKSHSQDANKYPSTRGDRDAAFGTSHRGAAAQGHEKASSEYSSSHGGVKAAIDAWSSKSKETRHEKSLLASPNSRVAVPSHSSPHGNHSVKSRETKQSEGSFNTQESNAISSEVSVGGSHASTFFSSPSSHASSKMSVGAPGSFFRPMGAVNDFEETKNDNLLGQLSGTSTDDESSALPSHLFKDSSKEDKNRNGDAELSFLLEQMKSESDSEDSGIKLLTSNEPAPRTSKRQDNYDHSMLKDQYQVKSSSYDNSNGSTGHKTSSTTQNEPSSLLGQSLLESEEGSDKRRPTVLQSTLNGYSESSDSSDSRFIKWWQNTDPVKRRQKFESYSAPASKPFATSFIQKGPRIDLMDDDDLFSGLSYDDTEKSSASYQDRQAGSFGDDIFSGVAASVDSRASTASQSTKQSGFLPPPPPPPLQTSASDHFGTILVHGSQAMDSVGSDITSSVLGNDMPRDWARREATAVIKEELTAEIEDEEDTTAGDDGDVLSDRRQKDGSILTGNPRGIKDPDSDVNVASIYEGEPLDMGNTSGVISETPKGDSIFMSLGCSVMEPLALSDKFCGAPGTFVTWSAF